MELKDVTTNVIVLECPKTYREALQRLDKSIAEDSDEWIFSENEKILKNNISIDIVHSLFELDFESRKIQKAILEDLYNIAVNEEHYETTQKLLSEIEAYYYELEWHTGYNIKVELDTFHSILKAGVSGLMTSEDLIIKLNEYIKISARLLKVRLIIFSGILENFTQEEWKLIETTASYEGIYILCIERNIFLENSNMIVIDSDNCRVI